VVGSGSQKLPAVQLLHTNSGAAVSLSSAQVSNVLHLLLAPGSPQHVQHGLSFSVHVGCG
jgi:hypothetical protein